MVDNNTCKKKAGDGAHDPTMVCVGGAGKGACHGDRYRDNCLSNTNLSTETQVPTLRNGSTLGMRTTMLPR